MKELTYDQAAKDTFKAETEAFAHARDAESASTNADRCSDPDRRKYLVNQALHHASKANDAADRATIAAEESEIDLQHIADRAQKAADEANESAISATYIR